MSQKSDRDIKEKILNALDEINTKRELKKYIKKNYSLSKEDKDDVYNSVALEHLQNYKDVDNYISQRFNITKLNL